VRGVKTRVMVVCGTRPDTIKLAPVILELARRAERFDTFVLATGQHREMLDQVLRVFGITPDADLAIMEEGQTPFEITARALDGLRPIMEEVAPDVVVCQGDTTTTFAAALAAFYLKIPVAHVEAGLRSGDKLNPFPEEANRRLTTVLADLHFAPTPAARANLLAENIADDRITVTGNTVIDALLTVAGSGDEGSGPVTAQPEAPTAPGSDEAEPTRTILVTCHRRENWGAPMEDIMGAIVDVADARPDVRVLVSVHPNPRVRSVVDRVLAGHPRIQVVEPVEYVPFVRMMQRAALILTDSGGIQEEAPSLGVPVLVLRKVTERPEGVEAGTVKVVGVAREAIVRETLALLDDPEAYARMARAVNPYGDGRAAIRIADVLGEAYPR
jgi:UDP-N-acetylglucosamine 2-epimerase (non-hydrolysing)